MSARVSLRDATRRMIGGEEGVDVEFKESVVGLNSEDLVAFANAEGGTILLGVREISSGNGRNNGETIGCETGQAKLETVGVNRCRKLEDKFYGLLSMWSSTGRDIMHTGNIEV